MLAVTPQYLGTSLPETREPISLENYHNLAKVAQWGRGEILGVAYSPDGSSFVVGSTYGFTRYDIPKLAEPPIWVAFDPPYVYQSLYFSRDGQYLLLENGRVRQVYYFSNGRLADQDSSKVDWAKTTTMMRYGDEPEAVSPDGKKRFKFSIAYTQISPNLEQSTREVYDNQTEDLLYKLPDETIWVLYSDYHQPLGCDLDSFSMCGNVYEPSRSDPYRVAFSPDGNTLTILYRAWNLYYSNQFSVMRVYEMKDGKLISQIGNYTHPVETFSYSPDGKTLLIGYVDGTVQLWDINKQTDTFNAHSFNTYIDDIKYSPDSRFLLIQRPSVLEVRSTRDGSLNSSYTSETFVLSPLGNVIAIGDKEGNIALEQIDSGKTILTIKAHKDLIFTLAFSPDGQTLVSAGQDCMIRAWDVATGNFLHYYKKTIVNAYGFDFTSSRIFIDYLHFLPGLDQLIGFGSWATVVNWNASSGATNYIVESPPLEYWQGMVTLNPHFPEFFSLDMANNRFFIDNNSYDLDTGKVSGEYQLPVNLAAYCSPFGPTTQDGKILFTLGYKKLQGRICILDAQDLHMIESFTVFPRESTLSGEISWLYISPDGSQLIIVMGDGAIYVYQINP